MLEQLKTGDVAAIDAAEPVANLVIALEGVRTEMVGLDDDTRAALALAGATSGTTGSTRSRRR